MTRRILIVTGLYPPNAPMATVRAPKFARFLLDRGYDVRVLSGQNLQFPAIADPEIPVERINAVPYVRRGRGAAMTEDDQPQPGVVEDAPSEPVRVSRLKRIAWQLAYLPDPHVTWIGPAVAAGEALARSWKPDVIFSTGPPHSSHMVAAKLSQRLGVGFVAELRDLWSDILYEEGSVVADFVDRSLERRTLRQARALVAMTKGSADILARRYRKPVIVAENGYDPADFEGLETVAPFEAKRLTIVHAGSLYDGGRSPAPLFAALARLKPDPDTIRVHFWGEDSGVAMTMAKAAGVSHLVKAHPPIGRAEMLRIERAADILLLLRFTTADELHVVAGKLYEYAGARRPVLCHGAESGEAADIIRQNRLGLLSNDTAEIAAWVETKIDERRAGRLPDLAGDAAKGMTRGAQFEKIEKILVEI